MNVPGNTRSYYFRIRAVNAIGEGDWSPYYTQLTNAVLRLCDSA